MLKGFREGIFLVLFRIFFGTRLGGFQTVGHNHTLLSLNPTSKIMTEDNDLRRQHSALNGGEMVRNATFLPANRTESWWLLHQFQTFQQLRKLI